MISGLNQQYRYRHGYTATIGNSWLEIVESQLSSNDFKDNMFPLDLWTAVQNEDTNNRMWVRTYNLNDNYQPMRKSLVEIYYNAVGVNATVIPRWQQWLLHTRSGSLILQHIHRQIFSSENLNAMPDGWTDIAQETTDHLIQEFQTQIETLGAQLLILYIPSRGLVEYPAYTAWDDPRSSLQELNIPYLDIFDQLTVEDYINENPNDRHWNNAGHAKAGLLVGQCLDYMLANDYAVCPQAVYQSVTNGAGG